MSVPPQPGHWYPLAAPPTKRGVNWTILGVAALIAAVVIVVVLHSNSGGKASDIASANDNGPVTVVTDDPSCAPWTPVINTLVASEQQNWWEWRDASVPASARSPEQRAQFRAVGAAMRTAADQTAALAKLTPHRVMRELYEQSIVYWRAYADSVPNYTPNEDHLAILTATATGAVSAICKAITFGSAARRGPLVAAPAAPSQRPPSADPATPQRFLSAGNPICTDWLADASQEKEAASEWLKISLNIPASQRSQEQKAFNDAARPVMTFFADKFEQLGRRSGNPTLEDFAVLSAQYARAYAGGFPTYVAGDVYLNQASTSSNGVVRQACLAVGS